MEKILYKKDSKGKTRIWKVYAIGGELFQEAGLLNGKLVKHSKICIAKNVGKSNETSPKIQALLEMESEYKAKLDEGYFATEEMAESIPVVLPMLAKSYGDERSKVEWDANTYIQPKLDGMRCLAHIKNGKVELVSRDGKDIKTMPHIVEALSHIQGEVVLDGELYSHGLNFQENMRLIKKYRKGESEEVLFHVYDLISKDKFSVRFSQLIIIAGQNPVCRLVSTVHIKNEKDLAIEHGRNINKGYEGSIIRHGDAPYKVNGRSSNLLKYKEFQDIACKIIDIIPALQRPDQGVPVLEHEGKQFNAGMKFSHAERMEWLKNKKKYIGKTAEIRFFEYSEDGVPRFPVCVGVRLDK